MTKTEVLAMLRERGTGMLTSEERQAIYDAAEIDWVATKNPATLAPFQHGTLVDWIKLIEKNMARDVTKALAP